MVENYGSKLDGQPLTLDERGGVFPRGWVISSTGRYGQVLTGCQLLVDKNPREGSDYIHGEVGIVVAVRKISEVS